MIMRASLPVTLTEFTPAEVESITGLAPGAQRDWRHRGFLPTMPGHARYDVLHIAPMYAMKALADRGIGPQRSSEIRNLLGQAIAWYALSHARAYGEDLQEAVAVAQSPLAADILKLARERLPHLAGMTTDDLLRKRIFAHLGKARGILPGVIPAPILIWWAVGEPVFADSYDKAREKMRGDDPKLHGPAIVFDLAAAGGEIVRRAGRPFVSAGEV